MALARLKAILDLASWRQSLTAVQECWFDLRYGLDTVVRVPVESLDDMPQEASRHAVQYEPTPLRKFDRALGLLDLDPGRYHFVDFGSGMSVSFADYDRDGRMDLYVGNMFSSAGNRIAPQSQFLPRVSQQGRAVYQRFAKGNSLFRNHEKQFQETGSVAGVEMGRWAWSSVFADIDNDGWDDLLVANGYITTDDTGDL